jgi:hypothetical protein
MTKDKTSTTPRFNINAVFSLLDIEIPKTQEALIREMRQFRKISERILEEALVGISKHKNVKYASTWVQKFLFINCL